MIPDAGHAFRVVGMPPKSAKALAVRDCQGLRSLSAPQGNVLPRWSGTMWFMVGVIISIGFLLGLAVSGQGLIE
jgi:hypothetical protein